MLPVVSFRVSIALPTLVKPDNAPPTTAETPIETPKLEAMRYNTFHDDNR